MILVVTSRTCWAPVIFNDEKYKCDVLWIQHLLTTLQSSICDLKPLPFSEDAPVVPLDGVLFS